MAEMLPWLQAPRNKDEFNELERNMQNLVEELYAKSQDIAAQMNHRLARPKSGSKWAEKLAWARVDLKVYARSVTKPIAKGGAAAIAIGKCWRMSHERFYDIHSIAASTTASGTKGFDFG